MKTNSRRIGQNDYIITELWGGGVRFTKLPHYSEVTNDKGVEYKSIEDGIREIQNNHFNKFKRYEYTIEEAIAKMDEFAFNVRIWEKICKSNGEYKKTGMVVVIATDNPLDEELNGYYESFYCRSSKKASEINIEEYMKMNVIDTSDFNDSDMFSLNHNGMSMERWMST
jgi:hypothetical protein|tara:strand:+ start:80 stop:586 length:507 start_codon:yes stop_codon:yes gene_type:complete